jgi:hypothetical protein
MTGWQVAGFLACLVVATFAQSITGFALALIMVGLTWLFELASLEYLSYVGSFSGLFSFAIHLRGRSQERHRATQLCSIRRTQADTAE